MSIKSHYGLGSQTYQHKGRSIISAIGNDEYDTLLTRVNETFTYDVGVIPAGYEHRPDRISNLFYGTVDYWWLILLVNNIPDPIQGLNVGDQIFIPRL